jgi:hypothetical protein
LCHLWGLGGGGVGRERGREGGRVDVLVSRRKISEPPVVSVAHLSRHCFPVREGKADAIRPQCLIPCCLTWRGGGGREVGTVGEQLVY